MRVLITGVTGFVGTHLAEALRRRGGHECHGLSRSAAPGGPGNVRLHRADLHDADALASAVAAARPEWVVHLAGYANTGKSFAEPAAAWRDNLDGTRHLLDAVAASGLRPRVLFVSTGLVYGAAEPGVDCDERTPLKPVSPYAASKAAAEMLAFQYTRTHGLDIVRVRPFNHIGPGQSPDYAVAAFARQVAEAEAGRRAPVIETGDLSASRDLCDVRDMVDAYIRLLECGVSGEVYNAGSGTSRVMRDVAGALARLARIPVELRERADPRRAADTAVSRASVAALRAATGWAAARTLEESLADALDDWRGRLAFPASVGA